MSWLEDARQRPTLRPYPLAALAAVLGLDVEDTDALALALGFNRSTVKRYRELGLSSTQADVWAERVGLDAAAVWPGPEWVLWGAARANALKRQCPAGHPLDRVDSAGRRRCGPCPRFALRRYRARKSQVRAVMAPGWTQADRMRAPLTLLDGGMAQVHGSRERLTTLLPPDLSAWVDEQRAPMGLSRSAWACMKLAELRAAEAPREAEQVAS